MVVNHFSPSTIRNYLAAMKRLYAFYGLAPCQLSENQLVNFVCHLKEKLGLSAASMRIAVSSIKYFYRFILNRAALVDKIPYPKNEYHIKSIMSGKEVKTLFDLTLNLKHRLIFKILYSSGLRRSELISLKLEDFDWENMQIIVRQGKGKKDRRTILAYSLKKEYLAYIEQYKPVEYFFYGKDKNLRVSENLLRWAMTQAVKRAGIVKKVHLHTFRHCFASHLISINTNLFTVQKLLGHNDIRTTMAYLHQCPQKIYVPFNPLDIIYNVS